MFSDLGSIFSFSSEDLIDNSMFVSRGELGGTACFGGTPAWDKILEIFPK